MVLAGATNLRVKMPEDEYLDVSQRCGAAEDMGLLTNSDSRLALVATRADRRLPCARSRWSPYAALSHSLLQQGLTSSLNHTNSLYLCFPCHSSETLFASCRLIFLLRNAVHIFYCTFGFLASSFMLSQSSTLQCILVQ